MCGQKSVRRGVRSGSVVVRLCQLLFICWCRVGQMLVRRGSVVVRVVSVVGQLLVRSRSVCGVAVSVLVRSVSNSG